MDTEEAILRGIRENPGDQDRWPVLADSLEEKGDPRADLVRLWHAIRQAPAHPQRLGREERLCTLLGSGLRPCVPGLTNSLGMAFSLVPPGTFLMGSPEDEVGRTIDEGPQHEVEISRAFYLG